MSDVCAHMVTYISMYLARPGADCKTRAASDVASQCSVCSCADRHIFMVDVLVTIVLCRAGTLKSGRLVSNARLVVGSAKMPA